MNLVVISMISLGIVAENNKIFVVVGIREMISLMLSKNPLLSISSASSRMKV